MGFVNGCRFFCLCQTHQSHLIQIFDLHCRKVIQAMLAVVVELVQVAEVVVAALVLVQQ